MIPKGKADARELAHARVLLQADEAPGGPGRTDADVAAALDISTRTIERVRQRSVEQGREPALLPRPTKRIYARALDGRQEAHLIAVACSELPEGKTRGTLRLPAGTMVAPEHAETLSHEAGRRAPEKPSSSRT